MTRAARQNSTGGEGERRRQARATPKKRKGVCWGQPVLTTTDHIDSEDECQDVERFDVLCGAGLDDDPAALNPRIRESRRTKRLRASVPFDKTKTALQHAEGVVSASPSGPGDRAPTAASLKAAAKKLKRAEAAAGKIRMSTAVPALAGLATDHAVDPVAKQPLQSAAAPALAHLPEPVRQYMASQGFWEPTAVQTQVWEATARGVDVLAQAPPGSGKTLAFLLPVAAKLVDSGHGRNTRPPSPLALIISPTHELAQQIQHAATPLQQLFGLRCACVHGGASRGQQTAALQQRPHLLVATPGRLLDLVDTDDVSLSQVGAVAIDECDKMLSLGFAQELTRIHALVLEPPAGGAAGAPCVATSASARCVENLLDTKVPAGADSSGGEEQTATKKSKSKKRQKRLEGDVALVPCTPTVAFKRPQVLLVSATMPPAALKVAEGWLSPGAAHMHVMHAGSDLISSTIIQVVHVCAEHKKQAKLLKHLNAVNAAHATSRHAPRVLVFANTSKAVNTLATALAAAQFKVASLHGKRSQHERTTALNAFKAGKVQMLVATDVAARGLHIPRLPYIVNYDFPGNLETYVHRVGRTGRLEAHGHVYSFLTRKLAPLASDLVQLLSHCGQAVDPNLVRLKEAYEIVQRKLKAAPAPQNTAPIHCSASEGGASPALRETDAEMTQSPTQQDCAAAGGSGAVGAALEAPACKNAPAGGRHRGKNSTGKHSVGRGAREGGSESGEGWDALREGDMNAMVVGGVPVHARESKVKRKKAGRCSGESGVDRQQIRVGSLDCLSEGAQGGEGKVGGTGNLKKKRRSRAEKRAAAADAGAARKKSKQGILGAPKTAEEAGAAYDSGQDSD